MQKVGRYRLALGALAVATFLAMPAWAGQAANNPHALLGAATGGSACGGCHPSVTSNFSWVKPLWAPRLAGQVESLLVQPDGRTPPSGENLSASSLVCLGCHDGVTSSEVRMGGRMPIPGDELNRIGSGFFDHPVGIAYDGFGEGYKPLSVVEASGIVKLPGGRIECSSCHDVHGNEPKLVRGFGGREICTECHIK